MKILTRYVLNEFARYFGTTLAALVVLFMLGDFIEKVDDYIEHHAAAVDVIRFVLYQLPHILFLMTPVAVLLSTLLTLGLLSRNGEVLAMKSAGIPLYRIAAPIFTVAVCLSAVIFWANETVIPYCNAKAEYIKNIKIEKKTAPPTLKHDKLWFRGPENEIVNIGLVEFQGDKPSCYGVTFFKLDKNFKLKERVDAERMDWVDERWVLEKGVTYDFQGDKGISMKPFDTQPVHLTEKPADFKRVQRLSDEMTFTELTNYITRLKGEGYNPVKYLVDLHGKVSFTFANIIMVIVAIPFSLRTSRSGGMAMGVGISIVLAISYWIIYSTSISLGHAGRFPPIFAAWVANLVYGASGLYMYLHADK